MNSQRGKHVRRFWVVSPRISSDVEGWRRASVRGHAAFMGWPPHGHQMGHKFAHEIARPDVILIARRHSYKPETVGYGVVRGKNKRRIKGVTAPGDFGSARKLSPFIALSKAPPRVPFIGALRHSGALAQLHPEDRDRKAHRRVCDWMDRQLSRKTQRGSDRSLEKGDRQNPSNSQDIHAMAWSRNLKLEYCVRTKAQVIRAVSVEHRLLHDYREWLEDQGRTLSIVSYNKLRCDGFEKGRRNLIEAKSSTRREHIRMAVGELLDYAYQGKKKFGNPHKAILLPKKPYPSALEWLCPLKISLIWRNKGIFEDNADGQFT